MSDSFTCFMAVYIKVVEWLASLNDFAIYVYKLTHISNFFICKYSLYAQNKEQKSSIMLVRIT